MEINEVWLVQWSENYANCGAIFSERERAINYIEAEAHRLGLYDRGFNLVEESICKDDDGKPTWGMYAFFPEAQLGEKDTQFVEYSRHQLNPR